MFCGKAWKQINKIDEKRQKVSTTNGWKTIIKRAKFSNNERVKTLVRSGVQLIAKEGECHSSCRLLFNRETAHYVNHDKKEKSCSFYHKRAFSSVLSYIKSEVIECQRSVLISDLLHMYKEEYCQNCEIL